MLGSSRCGGPRRLAALLLPLALGLLAPAGHAGEEDRLREAVAFARDKIYPSLVNISVVSRQFVQGREERGLGAGSGVIVSPAGHVVTNWHVAGEATRATCKLPSGEVIDADVVVADPLTDLCVLKLRMEQRPDPTQPLPFAPFGDSAQLRVGDHVMALGNPLSLSSSITLGIVSNTSRVFTNFTGSSIQSFDFGGGNLTGLFNHWIQHDALILPGNSGGPLCNLKGEVVGINTRGGGGMGFAVPANTVKKVLNQALTFREVRRGWIGVSLDPVAPLGRRKGALIASVLPGSPAEKAGLAPGDILTRVEGVDLDVETLEHVPGALSRIADLPAGRPARFAYERGGDLSVVEVMVAPMERFVGEERAIAEWGVSVMDITGLMAVTQGLEHDQGVVVRTIRPGSPPDAAKPALEGGDVVLAVGGEPVEDLAGFVGLVKRHAGQSDLAVRFRRGKHDLVTVLDLSEKPRRRGSAELSKAWLGVRTQVLTPEVAKAIGLEGRKGYRVSWVLPGTEAEKAGLRVGDVIVALNGEALEAYRPQDARMLMLKVEDLDIGADARLTLLRDGKEVEVKVPLQETPETAAEVDTAEDAVLEYKVRELGFVDRVERDLAPDFRGLLVAEVKNGSWAQVADLRVGDVILTIQGEPVRTLKEFKEMSKRLAEERPERVQVFVRRSRALTAFVFMKPDWPSE